MDPNSAHAVSNETAAIVALLRQGSQPRIACADQIEEAGSAQAVLEAEEGLLASELLDAAAADITLWERQGIRPVTLLDPEYPENLRAVYDRPPMLFVTGRLESRDIRSVAVIGSRRPSPGGVDRADAITEHLVEAGSVIVSGLAAGIDTAAHRTTLEQNGRTIAVIGTGVGRVYPPQNAPLQQTIAARGAVISQLMPDVGPSPENFRRRNAVISGLTVATVIVEATHTSGARVQARAALAHGRPVLLVSALLGQRWARELAGRPGIYVIGSLAELDEVLTTFTSADALVA